MASVSFFEALSALIFFILLVYNKCSLRNKDGTPKSFPVVGMMLDLLLNINRIHDFITQILETSKGTFAFEGPWFANINIMLTCDPANIQYIMSSNFNNFPKGPEYNKIFEFLGDGIFNSDKDLWKNQRIATQAFIKHHLFHKFLLRTSRDKVEKGLIPLIEHVAKQGLVVNLEDIFQRFTLDSTCILISGYDPGTLSIEFPQIPFAKALQDAEEAIFYRHIRPQSFMKLQRWLNIGQEHKYKKAWEVLDDIMANYVDQKREELHKVKEDEGASQIDKDGVDLLTSFITEEKSLGGLTCDDKFLRDTMLNMLLAGRDTTSSALTWFIWLVSRHPIVENTIVQELASKITPQEAKKRRVFNVEEVKGLVYLHGALCEALRLYPPVPFNHKEPLKPDVLPSGHQVHPNMKIVFNLYSMGRMKSVWGEDCLEFKPERWINKRGEINNEASYKFNAFGAGPRICLGKEMAFVQMKVVASAIVYNYRIRVLEETTPVVPAVSFILHTKDGLMTKISPRWD